MKHASLRAFNDVVKREHVFVTSYLSEQSRPVTVGPDDEDTGKRA